MLSEDEKYGILDLIKNSGQQIITMDTEIIAPKTPRFAINCFIQIWENYEFDAIKENIIAAISNYLISNTRRDRIPISDIISVVEKVDGVDSVTIMFDAAKSNEDIYGLNNYGIDEYGDIILTRKIKDLNGVNTVSDIMPLFRGNWYNSDGVEYSDDITNDNLHTINVSLRGISRNDTISKNIIMYR
jgi:hypothetical protein